MAQGYGNYDTCLSFFKLIVCRPLREYFYFHTVLSNSVRMKAGNVDFHLQDRQTCGKLSQVFPEYLLQLLVFMLLCRSYVLYCRECCRPTLIVERPTQQLYYPKEELQHDKHENW